ncbi:MAG: hypothetical protein K2J30_01375 [Clostridia bacterium]|nr:hypothetical protein [Clostridia bacterium]
MKRRISRACAAHGLVYCSVIAPRRSVIAPRRSVIASRRRSNPVLQW